MAVRVSPTERIRAEIDELFGAEGGLGETLEQVARLGARLLLQSAHGGRGHRVPGPQPLRAQAAGQERQGRLPQRLRPGHREDHCRADHLERPKLRETEEVFAFRLLGIGVTRTNALESLVITGFVRGLSTRDVEAALAEALGPKARVSRSTVSRICEAIKEEFDRFKHADLSEVELEYLFLYVSHFRMHQGSKAEPVLVASGIDTSGKPYLLGLEPGSSESMDACSSCGGWWPGACARRCW